MKASTVATPKSRRTASAPGARARRETRDWIVAGVAKGADVRGQRVGDDKERIAVGWRLGHIRHADVGAAANALLDNEARIHVLRQRLRKRTADNVRGAAGRRRDDEMDGLGRVGSLGAT
jgi:hypothetical protein